MSSRIVCLLGVLHAVGCTKPSPNPPLPDKDKPVQPVTGTPAPAPASGPSVEAAAFAKDFLKHVHDGTATAAQLTPQFKKVVAEPVFPADKALGYSDSAADIWLKQYQGKLLAPAISAPAGDENAALFTGVVPAEKPWQLALRLVKAGNAWAVDWFSLAELGPVSATVNGPQAFAATAFVEAVLGQKDDFAAGLMTPALKKSLAPPLGGEQVPFSVGILKIKLTAYRAGFTGFSLTKVDGNTATGELSKADGKKSFTIKLVPGERPFDFLVDAFQVE